MMTKIAGGLFLVLLVMGAAFYFYFTWSQDQIKILNENNATLTATVKNYESEKEARDKEFDKQAKTLDVLNKSISDIRKRNSDLEKLFSEHDFHNLTKKKPGLIENKINKATEDLFNEFETVTDPESYLEK